MRPPNISRPGGQDPGGTLLRVGGPSNPVHPGGSGPLVCGHTPNGLRSGGQRAGQNVLQGSRLSELPVPDILRDASRVFRRRPALKRRRRGSQFEGGKQCEKHTDSNLSNSYKLPSTIHLGILRSPQSTSSDFVGSLSASPTRPMDGVIGRFEELRVIDHEDRRNSTMLASCECNANRLPRGIPD